MEIRTAIFEDNKLIRDALQTLLDGTQGYHCSGVFADGNNWERNIRYSEPDVVLMDIEMPGINGIEVTRMIHEKFPGIRILIQTVFKDEDKIFRSICAGASGYMLKSDSLTKQVDAIYEVYNGWAPMSPSCPSSATIRPGARSVRSSLPTKSMSRICRSNAGG